MEDKRSRRMDEHQLDDLPESLQICILTFLDAKETVQTSVLSKPWISLCTSTLFLRLNSVAFHKLCYFDKFVDKVLRFRDHSAKLNTVTFTIGDVSSAKVLKNVLNYVFSLGANQLELFIQKSRYGSWPVCQHTSSDSLKTLILKIESYVRCPSLSGMFENLTVLHLKGAIIENIEPFSRFPGLERLVLDDCRHGKILMVEAMRLTDLTITCHRCLNRCELNTPCLKSFVYVGRSDLLELIRHDGLPVFLIPLVVD